MSVDGKGARRPGVELAGETPSPIEAVSSSGNGERTRLACSDRRPAGRSSLPPSDLEVGGTGGRRGCRVMNWDSTAGLRFVRSAGRRPQQVSRLRYLETPRL